jgi:hypothetical protein
MVLFKKQDAKEMIIARLFGGLGNQMFIYATAKAIGLQTNQTVLFDITTGFTNDIKYKRQYLLDYFNIDIKIAPKIISFNYKFGRVVRKISRIIGRIIPYINIIYYSEPVPHKYQSFLNTLTQRYSLYLEGYFQSPQYFSNFRNILLHEFQPKTFLKDRFISNSEFSLVHGSKNTVAIGIRRFQEVSINDREATGGILNIDYYLRAIDHIANKIHEPVFFIFSQDMEWVTENLRVNYPVVYISHKDSPTGAVEDLFLFSSCSHQIISNSTFYWWGAWLNTNTEKIVVAPDNFPNVDIIPDDWIKIFSN